MRSGAPPLHARVWVWALAAATVAAASFGEPLAALLALTTGALCAQVGLVLLFRRVRRVQLELRRTGLVATSLPFGHRVEVQGWSAREPIVTCRWVRWGLPLVRLVEWDLFVESEDGRRVHVATLLDHDSASFLVHALSEAYRELDDVPDRSPFAVAFGPMPARVWCEGEPAARGRGSWSIRLRAQSTGLSATMLGAVCGTLLVLVSGASTALIVTQSASALATGCSVGILIAAAVWTYEMVHRSVTRARGVVIFQTTPAALAVRASPPLSMFVRGAMEHVDVEAVMARPKRGADDQSVLWVQGPRGHRDLAPGFPIETADAEWVARVLHAYYSPRTDAHSSSDE